MIKEIAFRSSLYSVDTQPLSADPLAMLDKLAVHVDKKDQQAVESCLKDLSKGLRQRSVSPPPDLADKLGSLVGALLSSDCDPAWCKHALFLAGDCGQYGAARASTPQQAAQLRELCVIAWDCAQTVREPSKQKTIADFGLPPPTSTRKQPEVEDKLKLGSNANQALKGVDLTALGQESELLSTHAPKKPEQKSDAAPLQIAAIQTTVANKLKLQPTDVNITEGDKGRVEIRVPKGTKYKTQTQAITGELAKTGLVPKGRDCLITDQPAPPKKEATKVLKSGSPELLDLYSQALHEAVALFESDAVDFDEGYSELEHERTMKPRCDARFWGVSGDRTKDEDTLYSLPGVRPSDAVAAVFETLRSERGLPADKKTWACDCARFVQLVDLYALLQTIGPDAFNQRVGARLNLTDHNSSGLTSGYALTRDKKTEAFEQSKLGSNKTQQVAIKDTAEFLAQQPPGTRISFRNFDPHMAKILADSNFQRENVVKVGPDRYASHPFGTRSEREMTRLLAAEGISEELEAHLYSNGGKGTNKKEAVLALQRRFAEQAPKESDFKTVGQLARAREAHEQALICAYLEEIRGMKPGGSGDALDAYVASNIAVEEVERFWFHEPE